MNKRKISASMAVIMAATTATAAMPMTAEASTNYDLRKRVIGLVGIMNTSGESSEITRAEYASMLVNASTYRSVVTKQSTVSIYKDVPKDNEYASAIRIAAEQGWMTGYLGGLFKPDEYITVQEAARGVLALLGYTNDDFTGDQSGSRLSKYFYLELNENINKTAAEVLTKSDCVNLFYNLLKTDMKTGNNHYGSTLDCDLTSDGEIDPMTLADNSLKGPKLVKRHSELSDYIPFSVGDANIFLDGAACSYAKFKDSLSSSEFGLVIYYSTTAKTVWAYSTDDDTNSGRKIFKGELTHIYYKSSDVLTPSGVCLDDETGTEYLINTSDMQFAFSIYGSLEVGDDVVLICTVSTDSEGNETYTVIDYIED